MTTAGGTSRRFRIWIVRCEGWRPRDWSDVPADAVVLEPAEEGALAADEVDPFLEGFNRAALATFDDRWAIAVAVELKYEGDLLPGELIRPARCTARQVTGVAD